MKKGPNLRWSLIQCSGGDEGDRTPDLLTASQALSQLSYAPVRISTIRELGRRCKDNYGKYYAARGSGMGPRGPTMPDIARGARSAGGSKPAAFLPGVSACRPRCRRPDQSDPRCFRGHEPFRTPSGQFTEPCVARPSWSLYKTDRFTTMIPGFSTSHLISQNGQAIYLRFCGRRIRCAKPPSIRRSKPAWF